MERAKADADRRNTKLQRDMELFFQMYGDIKRSEEDKKGRVGGSIWRCVLTDLDKPAMEGTKQCERRRGRKTLSAWTSTFSKLKTSQMTHTSEMLGLRCVMTTCQRIPALFTFCVHVVEGTLMLVFSKTMLRWTARSIAAQLLDFLLGFSGCCRVTDTPQRYSNTSFLTWIMTWHMRNMSGYSERQNSGDQIPTNKCRTKTVCVEQCGTHNLKFWYWFDFPSVSCWVNSNHKEKLKWFFSDHL